MILNLLADADALFQINAALFKLGAGDTDFDQQLLPYPGTDGIEDLNEIPAAVLRGAAVFIGALIGQGGTGTVPGEPSDRRGSEWRQSRSPPDPQLPGPIPP